MELLLDLGFQIRSIYQRKQALASHPDPRLRGPGSNKPTLHLLFPLSLHSSLQRIAHLLLQLPRLLRTDFGAGTARRQDTWSGAPRDILLGDLVLDELTALSANLFRRGGSGGKPVL